jgi:hypothetical protein
MDRCSTSLRPLRNVKDIVGQPSSCTRTDCIEAVRVFASASFVKLGEVRDVSYRSCDVTQKKST